MMKLRATEEMTALDDGAGPPEKMSAAFFPPLYPSIVPIIGQYRQLVNVIKGLTYLLTFCFECEKLNGREMK